MRARVETEEFGWWFLLLMMVRGLILPVKKFGDSNFSKKTGNSNLNQPVKWNDRWVLNTAQSDGVLCNGHLLLMTGYFNGIISSINR